MASGTIIPDRIRWEATGQWNTTGPAGRTSPDRLVEYHWTTGRMSPDQPVEYHRVIIKYMVLFMKQTKYTYKTGHMAMEYHLGGPGGVKHVISSEALGVEGHIAFCAHIHSLIIYFSHLVAHLAIPGSSLSMFV